MRQPRESSDSMSEVSVQEAEYIAESPPAKNKSSSGGIGSIAVLLSLLMVLSAVLGVLVHDHLGDDGSDDHEDILPAFIYKVDGYHVFVDATCTEGRDLNFTWNWGDGLFNASLDHSPKITHTYYNRWADHTITLTVRGKGMSNRTCKAKISVPDYEIGACPTEAGLHPTPASFPVYYNCDISTVGEPRDYLDTPAENDLPNKWAILATCCHYGNTAGGLEADYYPAVRTLRQLGYPEEHFVFLEKFTYTHECINKALSYIMEMSPDFEDATVVFYIVTHGICTSKNCYLQIYMDDTDTLQTTQLWDYELRDMLVGVTPARMLFITCACQSGILANEDTTGTQYGAAADAYENPSMPGRIIVTGSTTPLLTGFRVLGYGFWEEGMAKNKGDSAPTGNQDGVTSVEEAFFYCKSLANADGTVTATSQPCMDDRYPAADPVFDEMVL